MKYNKEILNRFLTNKVAIAVRTSKEWDEFMYLLEAETDVKWQAGQNPTEYNDWDEYGSDSTITCGYIQKSRLSLCDTINDKEYGYEIIEFKELIKGEEEMALTEEKLKEQPRTIVWDGMKFQKIIQANIRDYVEDLKTRPINNLHDLLEDAPHIIESWIDEELKNGDYKKAIQKVRIEIE